MKRLLLLLLSFAPVAGGQGDKGDQGGRDGGKGVLFVALDASIESDAIHRAAWRALEPHDVDRQRMATFAGDTEKARAYLQAHKNARVVVAYDPQIAELAVREIALASVLKVYEEADAHVHALADPRRFFDAVASLPGAELLRDASREAAVASIRGFDWAREGSGRARTGEPLLSTSSHVPQGRALLTMRPDPRSLGLHVAAQVLRHLRTGKPFSRVTVQRMRLTIDLGAAKRAGVVVPLRLLARADVVRRP